MQNELPRFPFVASGLTSLEWQVGASQVQASAEAPSPEDRRRWRSSAKPPKSLVPSGAPRPQKSRKERRHSHHAPPPREPPLVLARRTVRAPNGKSKPSVIAEARREGPPQPVDLDRERARRKPKARGGLLRIGILPAPPTPSLLKRPNTVYLPQKPHRNQRDEPPRPDTHMGFEPGDGGEGYNLAMEMSRPGTTASSARPGTTMSMAWSRPGTAEGPALRPVTAENERQAHVQSLLDEEQLHPERPMTFDPTGKPRSRKDVLKFLQARAAARSSTPESDMDPALFRRAVEHHVPNCRVPPKSQHEAVTVTFNNAVEDAESDIFFMRLEGRGISHFSLPAMSTATRHSKGLRVPWARREDGVQTALVAGMRGEGDGGAVGVERLLALPDTVMEPAPLSALDDFTVTLQFCNNGVYQRCEVFWVGYEGEFVHRRTLQPGESYMERSFATHPWVVRDPETGRALLVCVGAVAATSQQRYSTVWNPLQPSLSWMIQSAVGAGEIQPDLLKSSTQGGAGTTEAARINAGRALLVKQLKDMRRDVESRYTSGIAAKTGGGTVATLSVSFLPKPGAPAARPPGGS